LASVLEMKETGLAFLCLSGTHMKESKLSLQSLWVFGMHVRKELLTGPECGGKRLLFFRYVC